MKNSILLTLSFLFGFGCEDSRPVIHSAPPVTQNSKSKTRPVIPAMVAKNTTTQASTLKVSARPACVMPPECVREGVAFNAVVEKQMRECNARVSSYQACVTRVTEAKSGGTGKGALIGFGAALLTGGSSLIFTGGGALVGNKVSGDIEKECGKESACDRVKIIAVITQETGLRPCICSL